MVGECRRPPERTDKLTGKNSAVYGSCVCETLEHCIVYIFQNDKITATVPPSHFLDLVSTITIKINLTFYLLCITLDVQCNQLEFIVTTEFIETFRREFRRIERAAGFRFKDEASCCGVTIAQCHAILEIGSEELLNVKDLAARLGLDKSTLSRTVENLVAEELAERCAGKEDRRTVEIRLTAKGRKAFDRINATTNNYYEMIFQRVSADKHRQIAESISLLAAALAEPDIVPGTTCCETEEK